VIRADTQHACARRLLLIAALEVAATLDVAANWRAELAGQLSELCAAAALFQRLPEGAVFAAAAKRRQWRRNAPYLGMTS